MLSIAVSTNTNIRDCEQTHNYFRALWRHVHHTCIFFKFYFDNFEITRRVEPCFNSLPKFSKQLCSQIFSFSIVQTGA